MKDGENCVIRNDKAWQDVVTCGNILRSLGTKLTVVADINFLSKMGDKVW